MKKEYIIERMGKTEDRKRMKGKKSGRIREMEGRMD